MHESIIAYRGDAVGNSDGGQAVAEKESILSYRGNAVGDGDGGQVSAVSEGRIAYRYDRIFGAIVCNAVGNNKCACGLGDI